METKNNNWSMTYQSKIKEAMTWLSQKKESVFLGEGLTNAGRIYSTLDLVPTRKCLEMPICENLIMGSAIGLALEGYRPIVVFQRMDFMLIAADAIINHLCLMPQMSGGQFTLPVLIRAIVGSRAKSFNVGRQHRHDFSKLFSPYIEVFNLHKNLDARVYYKAAYERKEPTMIIEWRDLYETN